MINYGTDETKKEYERNASLFPVRVTAGLHSVVVRLKEQKCYCLLFFGTTVKVTSPDVFHIPFGFFSPA